MDERFKLLVAKYVDGELPENEKAEFEKYMLNPACVKYLKTAENVNELIEEGLKALRVEAVRKSKLTEKEAFREMYGNDDYFDEIEADHKRYSNTISDEARDAVRQMELAYQSDKRRSLLSVFSTISIAITVAAVVFGVAYFIGVFQTPTLKKIYACYYKPYSPIITRSVKKNEKLSVWLFNSYLAGEYYTSAGYCRQILAADSTDTETRFIYGICLMETDSLQSAIAQFRKAESFLEVNDGIIFVFSRWYSALCYLEMGKRDSALVELKRLRESDNAFRGIVRGEEMEERLRQF
jgi:tetratricopeptide (TPR) repeat protein